MGSLRPSGAYRASSVHVWLVLLVWVVVAGIVIAVSCPQGLPATIFNVALTSVPFVYLEYWFAYRFALALELWPDRIAWRTVLGRGEVSLSDVLAFRAPRSGLDYMSIRTRGSGRIYVTPGKGLVEFALRTQELAAHVEVDPSWTDRMRERGWGRTGAR